MGKEELMGLIEAYGSFKRLEGGWSVHHDGTSFRRQADDVKRQISDVLDVLYTKAGPAAVTEDKH